MTTLTQQLPTGTWQLDPVHSSAEFAVKHIVSTFRGGFSRLGSASLTTEDGAPVLRGAVAVDSIEVKDENLRGHLLSPEFFDAANAPEITFVSTGIDADDAGLAVEGDLTIKGITRRVVARGVADGPAEGMGGPVLGVELTTVIDRNDFGLSWNAPLPGGRKVLADEVTLNVHLELVPATDA